jgi:hypothetical protein
MAKKTQKVPGTNLVDQRLALLDRKVAELTADNALLRKALLEMGQNADKNFKSLSEAMQKWGDELVENINNHVSENYKYLARGIAQHVHTPNGTLFPR